MSTKTKIYINGMEFDISSDDLSSERIHSVEVDANSRIAQVMQDAPMLDSTSALAFALFKLAGEYADLKYKYERLEESVKALSGAGAPAPKRSYTPARKTPVEATASDDKK